jgi:ABC-2 type transport system ATP-binding protein
MKRPVWGSVAAAALAAMAGLAPRAAGAATGAPPGYTVTTLNFPVTVGPANNVHCNVVGDLYVPTSASVTSRVPAVLTTNGFGGSKADQAPLAKYLAPRGYVVLSYSGLGFGGSGCNIELDDPDWDGKAASQLISFLGRQPEVLKDGPDDPRVGMIGGSYGGGVQFSTASIDPRLDTIVPIITWNDLGYSLGPNNDAANFVHTDSPPGVLKYEWSELFFGDGLAQPLMHPSSTPAPPSTCPGFDPRICQADAESAAAGYPTPDTVGLLRHASMVSFWQKVRIPTLLMQGEGDSLFTINEAVANYDELQANHVPVKLVIQSWGHSSSTPAPGELSYTSTANGYETLLMQSWFDHYLKHERVSTGPQVEYFRDWVKYDTNGSAEPAYGTAPSWPAGHDLNLYLSGDGSLQPSSHNVISGSQTFVNPAGGEPASYSETSGVQNMSPFSQVPPTDPPGTFASFTTAPLSAAVDSVGVPVVTFHLNAPVASSANPATEPVLFGKIYDVTPNGSKTLVQRLVAPIRTADPSGRVVLTLPGVVHRYAAGDRLQLVLAATDQAYTGSRAPDVLTLSVDRAHPTALDLPVVSPTQETSGGPRAGSL